MSDPFSREARDDLRRRLARLFGAPGAPAAPAGSPVPLTDCLPLVRQTSSAGELLRLDQPDAHTQWAGRAAFEPPPQFSAPELSYLSEELAASPLDPERVLYLDTETTGLAGGSGTYVFLVGLGRFRGEAFELRQLFLPDLDQEPALLEALAAELAGAEAVVTYNGKSYPISLRGFGPYIYSILPGATSTPVAAPAPRE